MELQLFEANNGDCPYLLGKKWHSYMFRSTRLSPVIYESLIDQGFRRSGNFFYKNNCPNCNECVPLRVQAKAFEFSKSQKRIWKKNQDIVVTRQPVSFDRESYELYARYSFWKHGSLSTEASYADFLVNSAVDTFIMKYRLHSELVGIGWIDIMPRSISSVYFAFHPDYAKRSLGIYSALKEIELATLLNKPILHLGFWVKNCNAMKYKQQFKPFELLIDGLWIGPLDAD